MDIEDSPCPSPFSYPANTLFYSAKEFPRTVINANISPYKTVNMYYFFPRQQNKTNPEATITNTNYISGHQQFLISGASLNL